VSTYLKADPSRAVAVRFANGDGVELAGLVYRPPDATETERTAAVVMCGPISSVKEQTLPHYGQRLADAGYTALSFDPAGFGESGGAPRGRYQPARVIDDYAAAVQYVMTRPDIDPARVSLVGVCMGGGFAVALAAREKRLRAAVSIAGGYNIGETFQSAFGVEQFAAYLGQVNALVQEQYETGEIAYVPTAVKALDELTPIAAMPNEEAYDYYTRTSEEEAPRWPRQLTADSLPAYFMFNAVAAAPLVAPVPLLVVHGTTDAALLPEYAQDAFDAALGVKSLEWIETSNHVELYDQDPYVSQAVEFTVHWLDRHTQAA
jgi:fermentation-respiration switch protein FrsA (DUF1100 family)